MKNQQLIMIPGFGESEKDKPYRALKKELASLKYKVVFYVPHWESTTIKEWLVGFKKFLRTMKNLRPIVIGFSFGSYIALLTAKKFPFSKMILCSLSPYFREDMKRLPPLAYKILGDAKMRAFKQYAMPINIKIPCVFLVGDKDLDIVIKRSISAYKKYKGKKKLIVVKNVRHSLDNKRYRVKIKKALFF